MAHPAQERKRVRVVHHDLKAELNSQIRSHIGKVDMIAHLAAGSHVDRSITYPMEFVQDNVVGTVNLMDYARNLDNLELFAYFSTDEVFGPAPDGISYKENDRYNSTNPYSASKAAAEEMVVAYENSYGLPAIITHTMNVFGERQHPEKYIPMCIKRVRDNQKITVHSNPEKTKAGSRHYIHARDVADALMFLYNYDLSKLPTTYGGAKCQKFNIVGAEEFDNLELAQFIADTQGRPLNYEMVDFHSSRPGHDLRYALDGSKMKDMGWTPQPVKKRLAEVINWTLTNDRWLGIE
jgi:dTDP-glucose 4,6-dehydratase